MWVLFSILSPSDAIFNVVPFESSLSLLLNQMDLNPDDTIFYFTSTDINIKYKSPLYFTMTIDYGILVNIEQVCSIVIWWVRIVILQCNDIIHVKWLLKQC